MQVRKYNRSIGELARVYPFDDDTKTFIKVWQEYRFDKEAQKRILGPINLRMQCADVRLDESHAFQKSIQKAVELAEEIRKNSPTEESVSQSILPTFEGDNNKNESNSNKSSRSYI